MVALFSIMTIISCRKDSNPAVSSIQPSDYEIEGTTLKKWKNTTISTIDMQSDPVLRKITVIDEDVFSGKENITAVVLPNGLETIGRAAFSQTSLENIVIPDGVKTISEYAFRECLKLTSVVLPKGLNSLGKGVFVASNLQSISIPNSINVIPESTFQGCKNLKSVTISEGITTLAGGAFKNCTGLTQITLPKTITDIHNEAFAGCTKLETVTIEAINPPNLGAGVFYNQGIKNIFVPKESVDNYKQREGWSMYISIIKSK